MQQVDQVMEKPVPLNIGEVVIFLIFELLAEISLNFLVNYKIFCFQ